MKYSLWCVQKVRLQCCVRVVQTVCRLMLSTPSLKTPPQKVLDLDQGQDDFTAAPRRQRPGPEEGGREAAESHE